MKTWKQFLTENENGIETRKLGKSLPQIGYTFKFATIYRALHNRDTSLHGNSEYVTLSRKFTIEHAQHQTAVHEEVYVVVQYQVRSENVYEAYNPGEYFYYGPPVLGKVIYTPNLDDY